MRDRLLAPRELVGMNREISMTLLRDLIDIPDRVHKGDFVMEYRDRSIPLKTGDVHIVPRGVEHRPVATSECEIVMIEPAGTVNTGDAGGDRTVDAPPWI